MRSTLIALFVLMLASGASAQTKRHTSHGGAEQKPPSREAADQAAIRKLQDQEIAANTSFNVDALLALWSEDGVLLAPGQSPIAGKSQLREHYQKQVDALGNAEILSYDEQWQEVRIFGDYAYEWGQISSRHRTGQSKAESTTVLNTMRILKRGDDGSWRIARVAYNVARTETSVGSGAVPGALPQ